MAKELAKNIYFITNTFPTEEKFGLTSQLRRAAISVSSNLAEGSSRVTKKDKAHFTVIAYSSTVEIVNQLIISKELNFMQEEKYLKLRSDINELTNKLNAYHKSQLK